MGVVTFVVLLLIGGGVATAADRPLRIVALAPHIVESLYDIGAGDTIIATTDHSDFPAAAKQIPRVGNYARLQIERIVQLAPDIIIAWRTGNPQEDLARLKKYGMNIVYSDPTTLDSVADELIMLGELTGHTQRAEAMAEAYRKRLSSLRNRYATATPVTGFYELWARPLRTVANNAWLQKQLTLCGVNNPFASLKEDYPMVSLEHVLASLPQVVIQPTPHSASNLDALDWAQWEHIPATANGFIFHPDADKTHRMTVRMLDEVSHLCELIDDARQRYNGK
ncbi:cobalamin-binding protein [Aestuariibacter sp. A3R04]|nr:cobalamin-binding protein [Aestuariibacter sp. A3R04]